MLHEFENAEDTESFLKENSIKFSGDCLTILKLLYNGQRLSGYDVVSKYGMDSRRLRDIFTARPDIVRKEWVLNENGKRKYVQYYITPILQPTKKAAISWATDFLNRQQGTQLNLL